MPEEKHLPALDGLRGGAILLVLLFHACSVPSNEVVSRPAIWLNHVAQFGWTGVDLFFVLSGFLITRVLREHRPASNYYGVFFARRALRLFPLYYLSLPIYFWIWPVLSAHSAFFRLHNAGAFGRAEQLWYWFNLSNWRTAFVPLLVPMVSHYWTLSIEEQFYAFWPFVVRRLERRTLEMAAALGVLAVIGLRFLPVVTRLNAEYPNFLYRLTPFRIDTLLVGALLALLLERFSARRFVVVALPIFLGLLALTLRMVAQGTFDGRLGYSALAVMYGCLLLLCLGSKWLGTAFSFAPLRVFGKYSYSIYVFHPLVLTAVAIGRQHFLAGRLVVPGHRYGSRVVETCVDVLLSLGVGRLTWVLIEWPLLRFKRHFRYAMPARSSSSQGLATQTPVAG